MRCETGMVPAQDGSTNNPDAVDGSLQTILTLVDGSLQCRTRHNHVGLRVMGINDVSSQHPRHRVRSLLPLSRQDAEQCEHVGVGKPRVHGRPKPRHHQQHFPVE